MIYEVALKRLIPNEQAFAEVPRDISMDMGKTAAGITFPTTQEGLYKALKSLERSKP